MKRHYTFIVLLLVCVAASSQNINDALRYSIDDLQGTARFQGMSGAFGALGGDLSALNINPAGSAVFNNGLITVSGTSYNIDNSARYFNGTRGTLSHDANINQAGGVLVLKSSNQDSPWKKVALSLNYDMAKNFYDEFFVSGTSNQGIDNYFLNFAQGVPFGDIGLQNGELLEEAYLDIGAQQGFGDQQTFLGFQAGIIDPEANTDANENYFSNTKYSNGVDQKFLRKTSGYNNKFTVNAASQYGDNLYIGASLNFHNVLYYQYDEFTEDGYDSDSLIKFTTFDNNLSTDGSGFSLSIGAIAKVNDFLRLGGSYQSPTWYRLTDEFSQRINTDFPDKNEDLNFINFNVVNIFETYTIKTPSKLTGSMAVIFGKNGLLSFDYGYQDMSQAEMRPTNDAAFAVVNNQISDELRAVSTYRIGGEYRIKRFSLRGGYRFEQSPYVNENTISDLTGFSTGIGYNFGGSRLDASFNRTEQDVNKQLFSTGVTTPARINYINTNLTLSYTLNF